MRESYWHLKGCHLFHELSIERLQVLETSCRSKSFAKKTPIYLPVDSADSVFLLASGRAKICHITAEGKQSILSLVEPGEIFGELAIFDPGSQRDEYAETIEKSVVVLIPREEVERLMREYSHISLGVSKLIGMRRKRIERRLKNLLFLSNRERLTHLLLELAEQYGRQTPEGVELGIKLSHQELANVIGSTRETVTVVLGEMQAESLVRVGRKRIVLLDPDKIAKSVQRSDINITTRSPEPLTEKLGETRR